MSELTYQGVKIPVQRIVAWNTCPVYSEDNKHAHTRHEIIIEEPSEKAEIDDLNGEA